MSNVLVIRILEVKDLASGDTGLMWVASDSYADAHSPTMSVENFAESYPFEHDLIMDVLQAPQFEDVAIITDNSYELDACSGICVEGYFEAMGV